MTSSYGPSKPADEGAWFLTVRKTGLASGHGAWADVQTGRASQSIETFSGPRTAPATVRVAGNGTQVPDNIGENPFDAPPLMYAPGTGLVCAWPDWAQSSWPGTSRERAS